MKILVTGSLGRIGEHLIGTLGRSHQLLGTDLVTGYNEGYAKLDVTSRDDVDEALDSFEPDLVIHMAGEVGRLNGEKHPERMIRTNALGTMNVARSCIEHGTRMINFSTSEVYGDSFESKEPVLESDPLLAFNTSNVYAVSKLFGEAIVKHYVENYRLKAFTVRPFMVYGEGETPNPFRSALTNFVHACLSGQRFEVHTNTIRAWCHVSDFVSGVGLLLDYSPRGYEAFNVGSEEYHTMEEAARITVEETGANPNLIKLTNPPSKFGTPVKIASIEKIKAMGYNPKVTLREGVRRMVKWQRSLPTKS